MGPNLAAYTARGASRTTALLAYVLGLGANDIHDGTGAAGDRGKIQVAGAGAVYDPANAGQLKTLANLRSNAVNPLSADGDTVRGTALSLAEQAL